MPLTDHRCRRCAAAILTAPTGPVAHFTVSPPVFGPGRTGHLHRRPFPARKLHLALWRRNRSPRPQREAQIPRRARHRTRRIERRGPIPRSAPGRRQAGSPGLGSAGVVAVAKWHDAATDRRPHTARPRLAISTPVPGPNCPTSPARLQSSTANRPTFVPTRRASLATPLHGTASSIFLPMAAIPFT